MTLLAAQKDRSLTQHWALWMIKRDPERGLKVRSAVISLVCMLKMHFKLLMPARDTGKRRDRPEEDLALLEQVTEASKEAGQMFLEYLVLQRRSSVCHSCSCRRLATDRYDAEPRAALPLGQRPRRQSP